MKTISINLNVPALIAVIVVAETVSNAVVRVALKR